MVLILRKSIPTRVARMEGLGVSFILRLFKGQASLYYQLELPQACLTHALPLTELYGPGKQRMTSLHWSLALFHPDTCPALFLSPLSLKLPRHSLYNRTVSRDRLGLLLL